MKICKVTGQRIHKKAQYIYEGYIPKDTQSIKSTYFIQAPSQTQ